MTDIVTIVAISGAVWCGIYLVVCTGIYLRDRAKLMRFNIKALDELKADYEVALADTEKDKQILLAMMSGKTQGEAEADNLQ